MLMVSLCKPVIHKLKILGGRKLEYCKSMREKGRGGENHEKVGGGQILKLQLGEAKGGWARILTQI